MSQAPATQAALDPVRDLLLAQARALLALPSRPQEPERPEAAVDEPRVLPRPCPCCGGRMMIIETFARGCEPKYRPTPTPAVIRIDTS